MGGPTRKVSSRATKAANRNGGTVPINNPDFPDSGDSGSSDTDGSPQHPKARRRRAFVDANGTKITPQEHRRLRRRVTNRESARRMRAKRQQELDSALQEAGRLQAENVRLQSALGELDRMQLMAREVAGQYRSEAQQARGHLAAALNRIECLETDLKRLAIAYQQVTGVHQGLRSTAAVAGTSQPAAALEGGFCELGEVLMESNAVTNATIDKLAEPMDVVPGSMHRRSSSTHSVYSTTPPSQTIRRVQSCALTPNHLPAAYPPSPGPSVPFSPPTKAAACPTSPNVGGGTPSTLKELGPTWQMPLDGSLKRTQGAPISGGQVSTWDPVHAVMSTTDGSAADDRSGGGTSTSTMEVQMEDMEAPPNFQPEVPQIEPAHMGLDALIDGSMAIPGLEFHSV